jgi:hypothetical protein
MSINVSTTLSNTLNTASTVANALGIKEMIIDTKSIRAADDDRSVVIFTKAKNNLGDTVEALGVADTEGLSRHIAYIQNAENPSISMSVSETGYGTTIDMSCDSMDTLTTRLANPDHIQAPTVLQFHNVIDFTMNPLAFDRLRAAQRLVKTDEVTIQNVNGELHFTLTAKDGHSVGVITEIDLEFSEEEVEFEYTYKLSRLTAAFAANEDGDFSIGDNGMMECDYDDLTVYIVPQF